MLAEAEAEAEVAARSQNPQLLQTLTVMASVMTTTPFQIMLMKL
jgi:hypothetical protein